MVSLKWCCRQKSGIKLVEPSDEIAKGYIALAENSLGTMNREREQNIVFSVSACYYSMYYSLYSLIAKIGVKSEIHACSIELAGFFDYSEEDKKLIKKAFDIRNTIQYYVDKVIDEKEIEFIISSASEFVVKSREILESIDENKVNEIRQKILEVINEARKKGKKKEEERIGELG